LLFPWSSAILSFGRVNARGLLLIKEGLTHGQDATSPMKAITVLADKKL
jgi:hypothetical protein